MWYHLYWQWPTWSILWTPISCQLPFCPAFVYTGIICVPEPQACSSITIYAFLKRKKFESKIDGAFFSIVCFYTSCVKHESSVKSTRETPLCPRNSTSSSLSLCFSYLFWWTSVCQKWSLRVFNFSTELKTFSRVLTRLSLHSRETHVCWNLRVSSVLCTCLNTDQSNTHMAEKNLCVCRIYPNSVDVAKIIGYPGGSWELTDHN